MSTKTYQIKPLEWEDNSFGTDLLSSRSKCKTYEALQYGKIKFALIINNQGGEKEFDSLEKCQQAAEAHHRAELEKHLVEVPDGWFPIETAPKDGQYILTYQYGAWGICKSHWDDGWYTYEYRGSIDPSHWRPIPPDPAPREEKVPEKDIILAGLEALHTKMAQEALAAEADGKTVLYHQKFIDVESCRQIIRFIEAQPVPPPAPKS